MSMTSRASSPLQSSRRVVSQTSWNAQATAALKQAAQAENAAAFVQEWFKLLRADDSNATKLSPGLCLWSFPGDADTDPIETLTRKVFSAPKGTRSRGTRPAIKSRHPLSEHVAVLASTLAQRQAPWSAMEALVAADLLNTFGGSLASASTWQLWQRLAGDVPRLATADMAESPDQLLMRTGEVPWLAGILLEPLSAAKKLREMGRKALSRELTARTDSDGTPHAELLSRMALWLAPLIRATLWSEQFGHALWSDHDRQRLTALLERAIPLCRPDGKLALSNGRAIPAVPLFEAAAKSISLSVPAEKLLRSLKSRPTVTLNKRSAGVVESMPSNQSDWARLAVLRSDWSSHADCLAISHHQPAPLVDVAAIGTPMLHGEWGWELQIGDARIEPADEWACSCWYSDPDADYLELQMSGPGLLRVERQILLSRKDHFLLLADCVRGAKSVLDESAGPAEQQRIHLRTRLPLASGVTADTVPATREIRLKCGNRPVRVFPLSLADDRVQSTPHRCEIDGSNLVLQQIGQGNGLYAPLLFDWHPRRSRQPALWRTLTVAESGKALSRDLAAGHRLQIGKDQMLIYRSLSPIKVPRTVLGLHTWQESVIARFDSDGDVEAIVKVAP